MESSEISVHVVAVNNTICRSNIVLLLAMSFKLFGKRGGLWLVASDS
jgi:hypothetical protein